MKWLLLLHAAATLAMVGIIWFVQVVHYPLFKWVGAEALPAYQAFNTAATTAVVLPPMLLELLTAVALVLHPPARTSPTLAWAGFALLALIWLSTAFLQVPQHNVLAMGFNASAHRALVLSNWVRTLAWSARGVLALLLLAGPLESVE
jgi:hypothetical protein